MNKKILCLILARGGSKRIPQKNLKKLAGKPLIAYTIESHRKKAPTTTTSVLSTCIKNVGVHLYLCERSQTLDNDKAFFSKNKVTPYPYVLSIFNKIFNRILHIFR